MKTAVIITIAGASTRFAKSLKTVDPVHKSIYTDDEQSKSLLELQLENINRYLPNSHVFIVTGYMNSAIYSHILNSEIIKNLDLPLHIVKNQEWQTWGSAKSLGCGMEAICALCKNGNEYFDKILFIEGDLYCDFSVIAKMAADPNPYCVTAIPKIIDAHHDVIGLIHEDACLEYLYDTGHSSITIDNGHSIKKIFASGQMWMFPGKEVDRYLYYSPTSSNLAIINPLFRNANPSIHIVDNWLNCNTIDDWKKIRAYE